MKDHPYMGKINHAGSQYIQPANQPKTPKGNGQVKTGNDLRTGSGSK